MDPDLGVLRYIARYQAHNHGRVTWYSPRFIDQDECILRYGNLVKALRALEQKGYLDPVPGGSPGLPGYRLSPAGEALLAANDTSDDSGRGDLLAPAVNCRTNSECCSIGENRSADLSPSASFAGTSVPRRAVPYARL